MAVATLLDKQFGLIKEATWGTPLVVNRFWPFIDESMTGGPEALYSEATITGTLTHELGYVGLGNETWRGDIGFELYDHNMGLLFELCMGTLVTAGAGPYTHTFTPGEPLPSATMQVAYPHSGATKVAKTFAGCVVEAWTLAFEMGKTATLTLTVSAKSQSLATAVATAVMGTALVPVRAHHIVPTLTGATTPIVKKFELAVENNVTYDERRGLGSAQIMGRQVRQDLTNYRGEIALELADDHVQYARYLAGTTGPLSMLATVGTNTISISMPNNRFLGDTPEAKGRSVMEQPLKFEALGSGVIKPLTIVLGNADPTLP